MFLTRIPLSFIEIPYWKTKTIKERMRFGSFIISVRRDEGKECIGAAAREEDRCDKPGKTLVFNFLSQEGTPKQWKKPTPASVSGTSERNN